MTKLRGLAAYALRQWLLTVSEKALAAAALILPSVLRTRRLDARLPQYQLGASQVLAEDGGESVEAMLMRMVEELIDLYRERLARVLAGICPPTRQYCLLCTVEDFATYKQRPPILGRRDQARGD